MWDFKLLKTIGILIWISSFLFNTSILLYCTSTEFVVVPEPHRTRTEPYRTRSEPYRTRTELYRTRSEPYRTRTELYRTRTEPYRT